MIQALCDAVGAIFVYLPAYGYDKQPAEKAISKARLRLTRHRATAVASPRLAIQRAFASVSHSDSAGYYKASGLKVEQIGPGLFI